MIAHAVNRKTPDTPAAEYTLMSARDRATGESSSAVSSPTTGQIGLIALFVTALVTAQLTAAKVLSFQLPVALPVTGAELALPGAAVAYAFTFIASDCYAELYGRRPAQLLVNVGFIMNFVLLALVWSTILAPGDPAAGVDPAMFEQVLGAGTNIVLASLLAYLVSQNYDVIAFHWLRAQTGGSHLWLRNIGSTATSQAIDTIIFVTIGFYFAPKILDPGTAVQEGILLQLILGQYVLKLLIAILDTPIVYAIVGIVRRRTNASTVPT